MFRNALDDLSFFENKYKELSDGGGELTEREEIEAIYEMYCELSRIMTPDLPSETTDSSKYELN